MKITEAFVVVACVTVLCGFGITVDIQCNYGTYTWHAVGSVYQCLLQNTVNIKSRESAMINSVSGSHKSGKSNSDVTCFYSDRSSHVIEYFPRNLDNIFTNLKMIWIWNGRLKEIQQIDLRPFTKLVHLNLYQNDIEFLEDGLFAFNPELQFVSFYYNKIIHIGSHVFENLNKLTWLDLEDNKCIDMIADNNQAEVRKVINQAKLNCTNSDFSTIDNELKVLEQNLAYASFESLPALSQNLGKLQNRFESSRFSSSQNLKQRFEKFIKIVSIRVNESVEASNLKNSIITTLENKIPILEGANDDLTAEVTTYKASLKVILIGSFVMFCIINLILVVIYKNME